MLMVKSRSSDQIAAQILLGVTEKSKDEELRACLNLKLAQAGEISSKSQRVLDLKKAYQIVANQRKEIPNVQDRISVLLADICELEETKVNDNPFDQSASTRHLL